MQKQKTKLFEYKSTEKEN